MTATTRVSLKASQDSDIFGLMEVVGYIKEMVILNEEKLFDLMRWIQGSIDGGGGGSESRGRGDGG